jgi:hypothetical protein
LTQNVTALAPGCLLLRTSTFLQIGALDANYYPKALFELDLCMRLSQAGLRNVWTSHAKLMNYRTLQPNLNDVGSSESEVFRTNWLSGLEFDPFHNPNLISDSVWPTPDFSPRVVVPWLPFKA